jgi:predicted TIM-barrel fold metal-dependent hydrolase
MQYSYGHSVGSSNRLNLDYVQEALKLPTRSYPIIDFHSHIHGRTATQIYLDAATLYGVGTTYSMTQLEEVSSVQEAAGECVKFICMPSFALKDKVAAHGIEYKERIAKFVSAGAQIVKFWNAPRIYEFSSEPFLTNPFRLNSPLRYDVMRHCEQLGLRFMTHIGDPDTWFQTKYTDSNRYGTKKQQYEDLEEVLSTFKRPWVGAHMLGYPEDLDFLSSLLERYPYLSLDCSATKWIVRELSKHPQQKVVDFFERWQDRILFGSDIVTSDAHLAYAENRTEMQAKASSRDEAFALYASRYWALRTLLETKFEGESPISDPDLHLVDPQRFSADDAPVLRGVKLGDAILQKVYSTNAVSFFRA